MAVVERFKQESMYGLSAKNSGRCRKVQLYLKQVSDHGHENKLKIMKCSLTFLTSFLFYSIDRNTYQIQDS